MELRVLTDMTTFPELIEFNYEELKEWLSGRLSDYSGLIVTEDGISDAKSDRASLNRLSKFIDDERKAIKKKCLAPYEEFEKKTKELVGMIAHVTSGIDSQIKAFGEIRKQEKYQSIEDHFNEHVGSLAGLVTLERVIHPKWANVGVTLNEVILHIDGTLDRIERDLKTIREEGGEHVRQLTDHYLMCLDLGSTLAEKARLIRQAAVLAERERRITEPASPAKRDKPPEIIRPVPAPDHIGGVTSMEESDIDPVEVIDFRVWVTRAQKQWLRETLKQNNIKYGKVPVVV